jgi:hypothetical protein
MLTTFPQRLLRHCRFTFAEFRLNRPKVGLRAAARYFGMRGLSPFGVGKRWQTTGRPVGADAAQLREMGFCELPARSKAQVSALVDLFLSRVREREQRPFESLGSYFDNARMAKTERPVGVFTTGSDTLSDLLREPSLVALASEYLQLPPWRLVGNANMDALVRIDGGAGLTGYDNALRFHRDVDSYRFLKMFIYLTDCRQGDGHHEIYLGSHLRQPILLGPIQRYESNDIEKLISAARLRRVEGPAGYMFAEDTFAFHRGTVPTGRDRLICNLQYMDDAFAIFNAPSYRLV